MPVLHAGNRVGYVYIVTLGMNKGKEIVEQDHPGILNIHFAPGIGVLN